MARASAWLRAPRRSGGNEDAPIAGASVERVARSVFGRLDIFQVEQAGLDQFGT